MIGWLMPISEIPRFEFILRPLLEKAATRLSMWTPDKAIDQALSDQIELWLVFCEEDQEPLGVCGTQIYSEAGRKTLEILFLGGRDWRRWAFLLGELEAHAKRNDCSVIRFTGRNGWARLLPDLQHMGWSEGRPIFHLRIE